MKAETSAPADTRGMGIVHGALRRDLTRASDALEGSPAPGDAQRVAIAQHVQAMMDFLHVHHSGEDAWLWPTMRRLNPQPPSSSIRWRTTTSPSSRTCTR